MDWTQDLEEFCGLLNSLQVAREREEPGACGLKIAHDCNDLYACNTSGWSCDYGCVWPCNVFGALDLSGFSTGVTCALWFGSGNRSMMSLVHAPESISL